MKRIFIGALLLLSSPLVAQPCKSITTKIDKFTKEFRANSELLTSVVFFANVDEVGTPSYYLRLTAPATPNANRKGVTVLFSDGSKMEWPDEEVEVVVSNSRGAVGSFTQAKCFVELSSEQLKELGEKSITDYRLYVYDWSIKSKESEEVKKKAKCLLTTVESEIQGRGKQ